jgi:hypothetical protein
MNRFSPYAPGLFKCSRCRSYRPVSGAQYTQKPGDPLHQERICAGCASRIKEPTTCASS